MSQKQPVKQNSAVKNKSTGAGSKLPSAPRAAKAKHPLQIDLRLIGLLRQDLQAAQWNIDFLDWFFGAELPGAFQPENIALGRHQLARYPEKPAALLSRLFQFGDKLSHTAIQTALPKLGWKGAQKLGLIRAVNADQTRFRAQVHLAPQAVELGEQRYDWWIASDLPEGILGQALPADHVLGVGGATRSLLRSTMRKPVTKALDLGTGCGIQALYLALHCAEVVATDISTRALQYGRFNAALAGVEIANRIDFRPGSFWEPVAGEKFDLIVSNPPFVITPPQVREQTGHWEYRDGGRAGDGVMAYLLRTLPEYLAPGGSAQMLGNWEVTDTEDWVASPRQWLQPALEQGCLAQVALRELQLPTAYANLWLQDGGMDPRGQRRDYQVALQNWVGYFEAAEVEAVAFGYLLVHSPASCELEHEGTAPRVGTVPQDTAPGMVPQDTAPSLKIDSTPGPSHPSPGCLWQYDARGTGNSATGADLNQLLKNQSTWMSHCDVWDGHWQVAADVTEQRFYRPGQADPDTIQLWQGNTWGLQVEVSALLAGLVGACDGELSLAQIVAALGQLTGQTAEMVQKEIRPGLEYLIQTGFLQAPVDQATRRRAE